MSCKIRGEGVILPGHATGGHHAGVGSREHHAVRRHAGATSTREVLHHGMGHATHLSHLAHLGTVELGLEPRLAVLLALRERHVERLSAGRGLRQQAAAGGEVQSVGAEGDERPGNIMIRARVTYN